MGGTYERIFVALASGETQEWVAKRAIEIAIRNKAAILFGHIFEVPSPYMLDEASVRRAEVELAHLVERARMEGVPEANYSVAAGIIEDVLFDELIEPFDPDLIICGNRGLSAVQYMFVGTVSRLIIENARCDVLVLKD
ncbi:MAG: universal stress protein [Actinobacteria bacterium]|nr:universal stress protein [Actinomycetota bacterium]